MAVVLRPRALTRSLATAAVAAVLSGPASSARQAASRPFTPEAEAFVESYLKVGGDKLTTWVQNDTTSRPEDALRAFQPLAGLTMELVAAEPVIRQPVDLHFDDRGRLWVVQYLQYPFPAGVAINWYDQYLRARYTEVPAPPPRHVRGADKITVLEDTDGNGTFDSHRDVITGLNITTSVLTGRGGVWVMNPPYLLFYPDTSGDGLPDGDPQVRLEGFGLEDTHSLANSLTWGPDGWLYGVHGSTSTARVRGVSFLGQAVWRYHPERDTFELFAEGGGNPWTLAFDSQGRAFSGDNGGNSRGFHWVPGGRYAKNFPKHGPFTRPFAFGHFPSMPHQGYAARFAMTSVVYEDGHLPGYEGQLISGMALTSRIQATRLVPDGATFRTVDKEALVQTPDRSFRPVDMTVGPDGAVYIADWCDIRMDHTDPRDTWDKDCGRIWRLRAGNNVGRNLRVDGGTEITPDVIYRQTSQHLVAQLGDTRKWYREQARRLLGERRDKAIVPELERLARTSRGTLALEALWARNLVVGMDTGWALELLDHPEAAVRLWTVRLLDPRSVAPPMRDRLVRLARSEPSAEVRSELAGAAARFDADAALAVLGALAGRQEDLSDRYLPLRIWWALEQHMTRDADGVLIWLDGADLWRAPLFTEHLAVRIARRLAADRGDRPAFTRIDPDTNWQAYAAHPRSRMPGGKGDYTDWTTNDTPAVRDRNLERLVRFLEMAPSAADRERLLAGAKAGFDDGPPVGQVPARLQALMGRGGASAPPTGAAAALDRGREGFLTHCAPCHQTDGTGMDRLGAPLRKSPWVLGHDAHLARIVLSGLKGELLMPAMGTLDDGQLAGILTYIRSAWGHGAAPVSAETVARSRAASAGRQTPWTKEELAAVRVVE